MIRVLYLIESLGMGGAERGLVRTVTALDRSRFDPEVAILGRDLTLAPELAAVGVPVHELHASRGPRALARVPRVVRLLRGGDFDVIHSALVWPSIVGSLAGTLARTRVVEHLVNVDPDGRQAATLSPSVRRKTRAVAALDAWLGRIAVDRYVAISDAVAAHAPSPWMRDPRRVRVVLRGQDLDGLAHEAAKEPDPPVAGLGERPTVITVGRLYPQKGQRFLIEAMRRVLESVPDAQLLLVGDGPLREDLERRARDLGEAVVFLGVRRDASALVARADVFAFPSLWEGQGNAVVEAAALGRPIVATRIPVMTETFDDGRSAMLVAPGDGAELAGAIVHLLEDPAAAGDLGSAAAKMARERFDIRTTTRRLESVYEEVVAS